MKRFNFVVIVFLMFICLCACNKNTQIDYEIQDALIRAGINNNFLKISMVIESNDVVYFSGFSNDGPTAAITKYSPQHNIYSVLPDTISAANGFYIMDDRIYFRDKNLDSRHDLLYQSCDLNGMNTKAYYANLKGLSEIEGSDEDVWLTVMGFQPYKGRIYGHGNLLGRAVDDNGEIKSLLENVIFSFDEKGGDSQILWRTADLEIGISKFFVYDDRVFFKTNNISLSALPCGGGETEIFVDGSGIFEIISDIKLCGEYLALNTLTFLEVESSKINERIYTLPLAGGELTPVGSDNMRMLNADDNFIYYNICDPASPNYKNGIYRCRPGGIDAEYFLDCDEILGEGQRFSNIYAVGDDYIISAYINRLRFFYYSPGSEEIMELAESAPVEYIKVPRSAENESGELLFYRPERYDKIFLWPIPKLPIQSLMPDNEGYYYSVHDGNTGKGLLDITQTEPIDVNEKGEIELFLNSSNISYEDGDRLAVMVFVNDTLQTITVDGKETCEIYYYELDYRDLVMIPISFKPVSYKVDRESDFIRVVTFNGLKGNKIQTALNSNYPLNKVIISHMTPVFINGKSIDYIESSGVIKEDDQDKNKMPYDMTTFLDKSGKFVSLTEELNKGETQIDMLVYRMAGRYAVYALLDGYPISIAQDGGQCIVWESTGYEEITVPLYFNFDGIAPGEHEIWMVIIQDITLDPDGQLLPLAVSGYNFTIE